MIHFVKELWPVKDVILNKKFGHYGNGKQARCKANSRTREFIYKEYF
jgi:hypothetical protein